MLGQMATPGAVELAGWLGCLFFLCAGANQVWKLAERARGKAPKPPNEELGATSLLLEQRIDDLEKRDAEHDEGRRKLYEHIDKVRVELMHQMQRVIDAGEQRTVQTHNRINEVLSAVSKVQGALESGRRH